MTHRFPGINGRQQQIQVQIDLQKDLVVCRECGGIGILFQAAFLPKSQPLVGSEPQIFPAPVILCHRCGQRLVAPFQRAEDAEPEPEDAASVDPD